MRIKFHSSSVIKQQKTTSRMLTGKVIHREVLTVLSKEGIELVSWDYPRFFRELGI